jgi:hypothetical protein
MNLREYPRGAVFHTSSCPDIAGHSAPSLPVLKAVADNPSHRYCLCTGGGPDSAPYVVIERVDYGDHLYLPSANRPRDAVRALCRTCRGTHGSEADRGTRTAGLVVPGV